MPFIRGCERPRGWTRSSSLPAIIIGGTTVAGSSIWPLGLPIAGRRVLELGARYRRPHWLLCRSRLRGDPRRRPRGEPRGLRARFPSLATILFDLEDDPIPDLGGWRSGSSNSRKPHSLDRSAGTGEGYLLV